MSTISLYFKEGSSDKVYHAQIVEANGGYVVNYQYGRRGSTLTAGTKTTKPVSQDDAQKIYDKLIREKQAKGYTTGESGTPYVGGSNADRVSGFQVQLLNPAVDAYLKVLLLDQDHIAQEKFDGKRMLLHFDGLHTTAINRKGLTCGAPESVLEALTAAANGYGGRELVIDGECIGDRFHAFDVLVFDGVDVRRRSYTERYALLEELFFEDDIQVVAIARTHATKQQLFAALAAARKEGIVFKHKDAPYTPGRPSSGGTQFKFKFQAEATCIVTAISSSKRSFEVSVSRGDGSVPTDLVYVGSVTVPANKDFPKVGQLVEVRYLYAYPSGSLYQPFYKANRDDKTVPDSYASLKFKAEAATA
jgi:bifunctional non-homologous end joining protein LigD